MPNGVLVLTLAIDHSMDLMTVLEYEVMGWGKDEESWGMRKKEVVWGETGRSGLWLRIDDLL